MSQYDVYKALEKEGRPLYRLELQTLLPRLSKQTIICNLNKLCNHGKVRVITLGRFYKYVINDKEVCDDHKENR